MAAPPTQGQFATQPQQRPFGNAAGAVQSPGGLPMQQMGSPTKEINTASYCRIGQEMVQDVVQKMSEIFQGLKAIQLPNGTTSSIQVYQDRKTKLEEQIRTLRNMNFKKLRVVYDKINEQTHMIDSRPVEELLPVEDNGEIQGETPVMTDSLKYVSEEHKELVEQLELRNRQLKEVIDHLRTIIWEINTMMAMRKT